MAKAKSSATAITIADEATDIIMQIKDYVEMGLKGKTFGPGAWEAIVDDLQPRIETKLGKGGKWEDEKLRPLMVSIHLGQIAAILTKGKMVSKNVAFAAYTAVRTADEACVSSKVSGGQQGGGDWCA